MQIPTCAITRSPCMCQCAHARARVCVRINDARPSMLEQSVRVPAECGCERGAALGKCCSACVHRARARPARWDKILQIILQITCTSDDTDKIARVRARRTPTATTQILACNFGISLAVAKFLDLSLKCDCVPVLFACRCGSHAGQLPVELRRE